MSSASPTKQILVIVIAMYGILTAYVIGSIWLQNFSRTLFLFSVVAYVGLGCGYILFKGYKLRRISYPIAGVAIIILVASSIFMYSVIYDLGNRVAVLEKPDLHEVNWQYVNDSFLGEDNVVYDNTTVSGYIFNAGSYAANVTILFSVLRGGDYRHLFDTELPVGVIDSRSYVSFSTSFVYSKIQTGSGMVEVHTFRIN